MSSSRIPEATVARLPVYLRALNAMSEAGTTTCSSLELATAAGVNSAKLRKDLSHLGSYGTRGVGYDVQYLRYQISREIGLTQDWPVVVVGIGNLGHALANYSGFSSRGFRTVALLDADTSRHGEIVAGLEIRSFEDLADVVAEHGVGIGVIATPAVAAQAVCDRMVEVGIRSILNFAPTIISVPEGVDVRRVDLSSELQILAYHEQRKSTDAAEALGDRMNPQRLLAALAFAGDPEMSVLVVGISHKTAPLSVLERVALDAEGVHKLIREVTDSEHVTEATVLSTCNRTEVYADVERFHGSVEAISRMLGERAGQTPDEVLVAPLRALRRRRGLAPVPRRRRAGLDGARREPDPRPDPRGTAGGPGGRHRRPGAQRPLPAGPARRQALARRDRHRPGGPEPGRRRPGPRRRARRRPRRQARRGRRRRFDGRA